MAIWSNTRADGQLRKPVWHKDIAGERKATLKMVGKAFIIVILVMYAVECLYFGALYRQPENTYRLTVRVLDLDSQYSLQNPDAPDSILGPAIQQAIQQRIQQRPGFHLGWQLADQKELSQFKLTPDGQGVNVSEYASNLVRDQTVWGAVVIHPNATRLAIEAAQQGISTYDPRGSIAFYYEEARNIFSNLLWVLRFTTDTLSFGISQASSQFATQLINASNGTALSTAAPIISTPFGFSEFNLVPFNKLGAEAPTTAGTIYLVIFTFFITPVSRTTMRPFRSQLTFLSEMLLTLILPLILWFWVSLCYSLVTLAFHVPMRSMFGHGGFPLYWMLNWVSQAALGFVMEVGFSLMGPLYFPFFLVTWVVINVSAAFVSLSNMDRFYSYGFVSPMWNAVDGSKCILLGTKNHLLQNFVVNLAWAVCAALLLMIVTAIQRRKRLQAGPTPLPKAVEEKRQAIHKGNGAA